MDNIIELNIYGVKLLHPQDWQIIINPNTKFNFNEGLLKIENIEKKSDNDVSLSLRWALMKNSISENDYINELRNTFSKKEKKSKGKEKYNILEVRQESNLDGEKIYFLNSEIYANHSILNIFRKSELVSVYQSIYFSQKTKRMLIASISLDKLEFERHKDSYLRILLSLGEIKNRSMYDLES